MEPGDISAIVERFVAEYNSYGLTLMGALASVMAQPDPTSEQASRHLYNQTANEWAGFLSRFSVDFSKKTDYVIASAIQKVSRDLGVRSIEVLSDSLNIEMGEFINGQHDDTLQAIRAQFDRDRRSVIAYLRDFSHEVHLRTLKGNIALRSAIVAVRIAKESPVQVYFDRSGKRWKGERYVRTLMTSHFVKMYNETYLYAMKLLEKNLARVKHLDQNHRSHNMMFAITSDEFGVPSYLELRESVFHPNSLALVVAM